MKPRRTRLSLGLAVTALALVLTGCAGDTSAQTRDASAAEEGGSASSAQPVRPKASEGRKSPKSPAASTPAKSPTGTPSASASPAAAAAPATKMTLSDRLLTAEELPGFNDHFTWLAAGTRKTEGPEPFGTCHKFAMTSIGAMRVVVRDFAPKGGPDTDTASHLVADFADGSTARRAFEVLKSWRGQCAEKLSEYDRRDVGGLQAVTAGSADAVWYMLTYGPASGETDDDAYFDAQGLARVGKRISVLQMRLVGQDYNYPSGHEPMVQAVRTAAGKLG